MATVTKREPAATTVHFQFSPTAGTVPPIYAFIEVIRAFTGWRRKQTDHEPPLRLVLHIQSDVELCLTSGRIDIPELLASKLIRFWVVVVAGEDQEPVRHAMHYCPSTRVKEVLDDVGVPVSSCWSVSVCPSPRKEPYERATLDVHDLTIVKTGIAFGSVLILEYHGKPERAIPAAAAP